jgi:hypothetical protein
MTERNSITVSGDPVDSIHGMGCSHISNLAALAWEWYSRFAELMPGH